MLNRMQSNLRYASLVISSMIILSSMIVMQFPVSVSTWEDMSPNQIYFIPENRPCKICYVVSQAGTWVSLDGGTSDDGTPAESHATLSDTTGITIVAEFYGYWIDYNNVTGYDNITMPGTGSIQEPGRPMLPCLFEYIEIPHDVNVSIQMLSYSSSSISGCNVSPAPYPVVPYGEAEDNTTYSAPLPTFFDNTIYTVNATFPGFPVRMQGENTTSSIVMRGRRLLGLSFFPLQYNPVTGNLTIYSQLIVRVKYDFETQIQPIPESLRSEEFERIYRETVVNYGSCILQYSTPLGKVYPFPEAPEGMEEGAEYMIITPPQYSSEAERLAEWKTRKGMKTRVVILDGTPVDEIISTAYTEWYPAPTYALLMGDVEDIPANYDAEHQAMLYPFSPLFTDNNPAEGDIASDIGYFCLDGSDYIPDMIYGRISVDTVDQARTIVDKILLYEQSPPADTSFYNDMLFAGYFHDKAPRNGIEDDGIPFIYTLEKIRQYMNEKYNVYINYSAVAILTPSEFGIPLDPLDPSSISVADSLPSGFQWLDGNDDPIPRAYAAANITANFNDGRFLILYYGHGCSRNMVYSVDWEYPKDDIHDIDDRGLLEGWHMPFFNTSDFSGLSNGDQIPLVLSIACNTGWFDGETDQIYLREGPTGENWFDIDNECFAENLTRLAGGGAIAVIASSRPAYAIISAHLLNGLVQAFWPDLFGSSNPPIYEMGTALLYGKLYAAKHWQGTGIRQTDYIYQYPDHVTRTTFEEFLLFGDPETQLWTDAPSTFDLSYPVSVGTSSPQRFVVTVRNQTSGDAVSYARVCIQQESEILVGFTDEKGQVICEIAPSSAIINVTVTKHNFIPHIGNITVYESSATVSLSIYSGIATHAIKVTISDFAITSATRVYFDEYLVATIVPGQISATGNIPSGETGFMNVWAARYNSMLTPEEWSPVSTTLFYRTSNDEGPDPYIYSQYDRDTWDIANGERVWDNPDIRIIRDYNLYGTIIEVDVRNKGSEIAIDTQVTLYRAPFGGGIKEEDWLDIGVQEIDIAPDAIETVTFVFEGVIPRSICLKVELSNTAESIENTANNIGLDNVGFIAGGRPGREGFSVGNPTGSDRYLFIKIVQRGNHTTIWNTTVPDYQSTRIESGNVKNVTMTIYPKSRFTKNESIYYTADFMIDCDYTSGMVLILDSRFKTCCCCIIIMSGLLVVLVWYVDFRIRRDQDRPGSHNPPN